MSQAVVHNGVAYLAGVVPEDATAPIAEQTRQVLARIDRLLALAGTDKSRLLKVNIWIADVAHFGEMNQVWDAWVTPGHTPARATVESRLAGGYQIEIMVEAAV